MKGLMANQKKSIKAKKEKPEKTVRDGQNKQENSEKRKRPEAELSKREIRRRRRIRNQTIAYAVLVAVAGVVIFFGLWGTKQILNGFENKPYNINDSISLNEGDQVGTSEDGTGFESDMNFESTEIQETEAQEVQTRDELDDVVDAYLADMTLEQKVAQMFLITPESLTNIPGPASVAGSKTEAAMKETAIGGLLFQAKNFTTKEQAKEMVTKSISLAQRPIFTAAFEESGASGTLSSVAELEVTKTSSFPEIGASADPNQAYNAGNTIGTYLASYGFDLDFAPVADMAESGSASGLEDRCFGTDATVVSEMVANYVKGLQDAGVSACLTHFPGHGSTSASSQVQLASTERTLEEMRSYEFLPFQAGIDAGCDFVMVGHISAPNVTGDSTPASLSSLFITDVLKNELKFKGIVITDRMDMPSITDYYTVEQATLMAVNAGADMILCPQDYKTAYNALLSAVQNGVITQERIDESLHRIYRVKLEGTITQ